MSDQIVASSDRASGWVLGSGRWVPGHWAPTQARTTRVLLHRQSLVLSPQFPVPSLQSQFPASLLRITEATHSLSTHGESQISIAPRTSWESFIPPPRSGEGQGAGNPVASTTIKHARKPLPTLATRIDPQTTDHGRPRCTQQRHINECTHQHIARRREESSQARPHHRVTRLAELRQVKPV
jgi:hypothetical protein